MGKSINHMMVAVLTLLAAFAGESAAAGPPVATVSAEQLADGAVTYRAIAPNSIANSKILDGAVSDAKLGFGAVTTPKIADGAVTDAKITGPIAGTKLGRHGHDAADIVQGTIDIARLPVGTGPEMVAAGNHTHPGLKKPANVIVVARSGGDFTNPLEALNAISDASADNPYLVKIMPGIYDLGLATLVMKEYVDIEGSGETTTRLRGSGGSAGVVAGASRAELRNLTVEAGGVDGEVVGIFNGNASPRLSHLAVEVHGEKSSFGIYNMMAAPRLSDVIVSVTGSDTTFGIFNLHSSPEIRNATVTAGNGIYTASSGTVLLEGSAITGSILTIYNDSGTTTRIANTRLAGGRIANNGLLSCAGVYDDTFLPVSCP